MLTVILLGITSYSLWGIKAVSKESNQNITIVPTIDQTEPLEHPHFIKEEYIPVIPEGENIAQNGKIKSTDFEGSYTPRKAIDGNAMGISYWEGKKDTYPNYLWLDLKDEYEIHAVRVCLSPTSLWGKRTQTFSVQISDDGENYKDLVKEAAYIFAPDTNNEVVIEFESVTTRYISLVFMDNTGSGGGQVAEFEVYEE